MQKIVLFAGLICAFCLFNANQAAPADTAALEAAADQLALLEQVPALELSRDKRATCDLLSGFGLKHTACAGHCLVRGNRGGYCNGRGVCVCRN
ncbi:PREDICTED: phormicin-like [Rhagoletis zephyria]|uniref:phormicin-like n=1 Tax=Rhagoletis zephyria TaxID=28612 RepID=UPI000811732E|nr:PREDICTED: phormicin-like [Rhagoletis zephyria]